jgi:DNA modification methylase
VKYKNRILCGHTLEVTKQLPDEIFDTIITSCPYWGLRDYGESTNTIWDGDPNCNHKWEKLIPRKYHKAGETNPGKEGYTKDVGAWGQASGQFCSLCGAWYGQLGLEPTLDLYLSHLWQITDELYRVLKKTGVMYWNHSDCYGGSGSQGDQRNTGSRTGKFDYGRPYPKGKTIPKCLAMQNYRLVLGMVDRGWILRNTIIWDKPNHMPSSVKDRFTSSYEPIFMLTKNNKPQYYYNTKTGLMADKKPKKLIEGIDWDWKEGEPSWQRPSRDETFKTPSREKSTYAKGKRKKVSYWKSVSYWFDLDAVRQPHKESSINRLFRGSGKDNKYSGELYGGKQPSHTMSKPRKRIPKEIRPGIKEKLYHQQSIIPSGGSHKKISNMLTNLQKSILTSGGKNPGDVWTIPTQPFPEAHFATFPEKLIEPMILSSCPQWICKKCGKARVRIVELGEFKSTTLGVEKITRQSPRTQTKEDREGWSSLGAYERNTIGWSDCGCNAGWCAGIVLDPFIGSGTTGLVAKKLGRNYSGIELNPTYKKMADKRLMAIPDNLPFE